MGLLSWCPPEGNVSSGTGGGSGWPLIGSFAIVALFEIGAAHRPRTVGLTNRIEDSSLKTW